MIPNIDEKGIRFSIVHRRDISDKTILQILNNGMDMNRLEFYQKLLKSKGVEYPEFTGRGYTDYNHYYIHICTLIVGNWLFNDICEYIEKGQLYFFRLDDGTTGIFDGIWCKFFDIDDWKEV